MTTVAGITRGVAIGLWTLAGLAYVVRAITPGTAVDATVGPLLLSAAAVWTALLGRSSPPGPERNAPQGISRYILLALGGLCALGIAIVSLPTGDQRSFLYIAYTALIATLLGAF